MNIFDIEMWRNVLTGVMGKFLGFLPNIIVAVLVFTVGVWISAGIGSFISKLLGQLPFDKIFEKKGWDEAFKKASFKVKPSAFFGNLVKWAGDIIVLIITVNILGFKAEFEGISAPILGYVQNILMASLLFVILVIAIDVLEKVIVVSVEKIGVSYAKLLGTLVRVVLWIVGITEIIRVLQIADHLSVVFQQALLYGTAFALALAFGLGGKEVAGDFLKDIRDKLKD